MRWETPAVEEIGMSAEIGAYQDDLDEDAGGARRASADLPTGDAGEASAPVHRPADAGA